MKEKELEKILKALANKRRISILKYLKSESSASVGDIADEIKLSFRATSKHLMILSRADIVGKEQVSLTMVYGLEKEKHPIVQKLLELF
ncbi:MAG: metalloregulator ArsR/SmtB family transcription factor [Patescibacteria group bacterium]